MPGSNLTFSCPSFPIYPYGSPHLAFLAPWATEGWTARLRAPRPQCLVETSVPRTKATTAHQAHQDHHYTLSFNLTHLPHTRSYHPRLHAPRTSSPGMAPLRSACVHPSEILVDPWPDCRHLPSCTSGDWVLYLAQPRHHGQ